MRLLAGIIGCAWLGIVLVDSFETIVLARRAQRVFRFTRLFYNLTWKPFAAIGRRIHAQKQRENVLSVYGPLSLLTLLVLWAVSLVLAFGLLQWSTGLRVEGQSADLGAAIYVSGSSFFTLGVQQPSNWVSRWLTVIEAGLGFTFLGLVIGYLPTFYLSYSARELRISLLDSRAGSPPSASELLLREGQSARHLEQQLLLWEEWAATVLQSQLSYPAIAYFRSQHSNQSWLAALIAVCDASSLVMLGAEGELKHQGELTFAMGRHALVDLATVFRTAPRSPREDRLPAAEFSRLRAMLGAGRTSLRMENVQESELAALRAVYEPYANVLGAYFLMPLPSWLADEKQADNWEITSWGRTHLPSA